MNYYFASREAMFMAAVRLAVSVGQQTIAGKLKDAKAWEDQLAAIIDGNFSWLERHPDHAAVMITFYAHCLSKGPFRTLQNEIRRRGMERFRAGLTPAVTHLSVAKRTELATAIQALVAGQLIFYFSADCNKSLSQLKRETIRQALEMVKNAGRGRESKRSDVS